MTSAAPRLSVQIVAWNSAEVLGTCLASLTAQTCRAFEVVVADNASQDASARIAEEALGRLPAGQVLRLLRNEGFSGGQNRATSASRGDLLLFLNPDTVVPPEFVGECIRVADSAPPTVGSFAPCILLDDGRVDSTGLVIDRFRRAYDRDQGRPAAARWEARAEVFGCTGAAALHRRSMLLDVADAGEVLDETLFAYYDDLDLSWRAAFRGWSCRYAPSLVVQHHRMGRNAIRGLRGRRTASGHQALTLRNRVLVMAKCERVRDLVPALPWLVPFEILRAGYLLVRAPSALKGYLGVVSRLGDAMRRRRHVQATATGPGIGAFPWRAR